MTTHKDIAPENIEAAKRIYDEYGEYIYRVICYKLSDKSLADDIYQDFFLALCTNPIPPLEASKLKAYLYKAIGYDILNAIRHIRTYRKNIRDFSEKGNSGLHKSNPEGAYNVEDELESLFKDMWDEIPLSEKKAISLRYLQEYSNEEVAREMNIKQGSVRNYLNRGLTTLRQKLTRKQEASK